MYEYRAKVEKVVDGDTIDVIIDLGFKILTTQRLRLARVNTPEIYRRSKDSEEYRRGMEAKEYVIRRLEENGNEFLLKTFKHPGKYGRYIAEVHLEDSGKTLNQELLEKGLAEEVDY